MRVLSIILIFTFFNLQGQNRKPIPKPDTLYLDANLNTFEANVLINDIDPDGNAKKATSFKIGSTSYAINQIVYLPGKGIFSIRTDGSVFWCPYYYWTGVINFSYVVNDYFTGNGKTSPGCVLVSKYVCDWRDENGNCKHQINHDL